MLWTKMQVRYCIQRKTFITWIYAVACTETIRADKTESFIWYNDMSSKGDPKEIRAKKTSPIRDSLLSTNAM